MRNLDVANDAIIAYAISRLTPLGTLEGLSDAARVVQKNYTVMQKRQDASHHLWVELVQFRDAAGSS